MTYPSEKVIFLGKTAVATTSFILGNTTVAFTICKYSNFQESFFPMMLTNTAGGLVYNASAKNLVPFSLTS